MERILTFSQALQEATAQEMSIDPSVMVFGIGVDDHKAVYGTTEGLLEQFGPERVFDTPLAEDAMTGIAIGAALGGMRPIHVHIRMDFLMLCMNQIVNIASKSRYMYGGSVSVPIVIRSVIGRSWGQGAQHSQGLHALFMHIPGLRVVAPSTPYDAKGTMLASIRDDNPVIYIEHRMVHHQKGHVPEEKYTVPFGKARILAPGKDITIVGISYMAVESIRARKHLQKVDIDAEVIDPVSLVPLDINTITASVEKTGNLLIVDTGWTSCGASAEILAQVVERLQGKKNIMVRRMGFAPVVCPTTKNLENLFYPNPQTIASTAYSMLHGEKKSWTPEGEESVEIVEFKGPF